MDVKNDNSQEPHILKKKPRCKTFYLTIAIFRVNTKKSISKVKNDSNLDELVSNGKLKHV